MTSPRSYPRAGLGTGLAEMPLGTRTAAGHRAVILPFTAPAACWDHPSVLPATTAEGLKQGQNPWVVGVCYESGSCQAEDPRREMGLGTAQLWREKRGHDHPNKMTIGIK